MYLQTTRPYSLFRFPLQVVTYNCLILSLNWREDRREEVRLRKEQKQFDKPMQGGGHAAAVCNIIVPVIAISSRMHCHCAIWQENTKEPTLPWKYGIDYGVKNLEKYIVQLLVPEVCSHQQHNRVLL